MKLLAYRNPIRRARKKFGRCGVIAFEWVYRATCAHLLGVVFRILNSRERAEEVLRHRRRRLEQPDGLQPAQGPDARFRRSREVLQRSTAHRPRHRGALCRLRRPHEPDIRPARVLAGVADALRGRREAVVGDAFWRQRPCCRCGTGRIWNGAVAALRSRLLRKGSPHTTLKPTGGFDKREKVKLRYGREVLWIRIGGAEVQSLPCPWYV